MNAHPALWPLTILSTHASGKRLRGYDEWRAGWQPTRGNMPVGKSRIGASVVMVGKPVYAGSAVGTNCKSITVTNSKIQDYP